MPVDPDISRHFARTTFHADDRDAFAAVTLPTLLLDSRDDAVAPTFVGDWMERHIPQARRVVLPTEGHCPHMTEPDLVEAACVAIWTCRRWTWRPRCKVRPSCWIC